MRDSRDHEAMVREPRSWWLDESAYAGRENLDEQHMRRYDTKEEAEAAEESRMCKTKASSVRRPRWSIRPLMCIKR